MTQVRLDWQKLRHSCGEDAVFQAELLALFVQHTQVQLAALQEARENQDLQAIAQLSHQVKGACGSIGAQVLHQCLSALEQCAQQGDSSQLEPLLASCVMSFQDVLAEVEMQTQSIAIESGC
jgi:HPt (histidine-containing phosphotransfer) domain-containing protein